MKTLIVLALAATVAFTGSIASAEPVTVEALLTPEEQMKFEFADAPKHFVLAVRRQGTAQGSGVFDGASVTEFGWHDVNPPVSGDPQGYLQLTTPDGDTAVLRWSARALFLNGKDGARLINDGTWELVGGTGVFENQRGLGSLTLEPQGGPTRFILEGEVGEQP